MNKKLEKDLPKRDGFRIFRHSDAAAGLGDHMSTAGLDEPMTKRLKKLSEVQGPNAAETRYLFGGNGMSLASVWFKSGYPLPIHTHNADCLYYIVAGSLTMGTETLNAGDGFFVPAEVPYTYVAGPHGVELLEFRTAEEFDIRFTAKNQKYWDKRYAKIAERRPLWEVEPRPERDLVEEA